MRQKRWALSVPVDGFSLAEHGELAREAERLGYTDAWSLEVDGVDCFAPLAVIASATRLRVGTAIANVYTRGPATLASSAAGLADIAPGRFCLGIGAGSQPIVEAWNGGAFTRPAAIEITARLLVNVDPAGPETDVAVRRHVTAYLNVPVYKAFHEWLGRSAALAPMWTAWAAGDRKGAVAAVPEQVLRDLIVRGSMEEITRHVRRYLDAGIDTAFLALSTREPDPTRKREIMLTALRALAPREQ